MGRLMTLYSRVAGQGEPVVIVHGLFGSMENLGTQARALAEQFRVYSIDLPNHGRSPHHPDMNLQSMAEDIIQWMDEHNLPSAHFVGHSLGGKAVMELAMRYPERCRRIAVIDIAPVRYEPRHYDVFSAFNAVDPSLITNRSEADTLMKPYVQEVAVRSFLLKNLIKVDSGYQWRLNLPALIDNYDALIDQNYQGAVFNQPILFIKGGDSSYITESYREAITMRFSQVSLKVVPNTGHWLHAEKPEHISRLLHRFLAP